MVYTVLGEGYWSIYCNYVAKLYTAITRANMDLLCHQFLQVHILTVTECSINSI